jgi:hypothetical protein
MAAQRGLESSLTMGPTGLHKNEGTADASSVRGRGRRQGVTRFGGKKKSLPFCLMYWRRTGRILDITDTACISVTD